MKLLIISTSAGTGHVQAAAALEEAALRTHPEVEVHNVDALDHGTPLLRHMYASSYEFMANRYPALWGYLYYRFESDTPGLLGSRILGRLDRLNARPLVAMVRRLRPDRILCTHFLPPSALRHEARAPIDVVVTDLDVHSFWIQPEIRRFHLASDSVRTILERKGIDPSRIAVHGIPVSDRFRDPPPRVHARAALEIDPRRPVVLAMGGGFGRRGLLDVVGAAADAATRPTVLAVAGRSDSMWRALERRFGPEERVRTFRFVRRIETLMAACDVLVTKPGGLTTSEALAVGRPQLLTAPVPGQEEFNARYLVAAGAARTAVTPEALRTELDALLSDPSRLVAMESAARAASRPDAAERIVAETIEDRAGPARAGR